MSGFGSDFPDVDVPPPWEEEAPEPIRGNFDRSWQPVDLADVLSGHYAPPQPSVGQRTDGIGLFYPGKVHTISSESEAGKTWLALAAVRDELDEGNHVVYLDFEDDPGSLVGRLLLIGTDRDVIRDRFHYVRPTEQLRAGIHRDDLGRLMAETRPTLVILDGVTEAMTLHGLNPLDNKDIASFGRLLPRALARFGSAVACLDHLVKNREGQGRYALGGVHKLNGLDGAAYILENRQPFGIGLTGRSTVKLSKDRPGQLRVHGLPSSMGLFWFADLVVTSHGTEFAEVELHEPQERGDDFRPTVLMGRVSAALTGATEPLSLRGVLDRVKGKDEEIRRAIAALVDDRYITTSPGPRGATLHTLVKPYPDDNGEGSK